MYVRVGVCAYKRIPLVFVAQSFKLKTLSCVCVCVSVCVCMSKGNTPLVCVAFVSLDT